MEHFTVPLYVGILLTKLANIRLFGEFHFWASTLRARKWLVEQAL
jgi:hypothetical protein